MKGKVFIMEEHLCVKCYEVRKGYHEVANGSKVCDECGGTVLNLQEAADMIASLKSELDYIQGRE